MAPNNMWRGRVPASCPHHRMSSLLSPSDSHPPSPSSFLTTELSDYDMESSASAGMHQEGHNEALAQDPVVEVQRQVEGEANNVFSFSGDMITLLVNTFGISRSIRTNLHAKVGEKLYRVHEYLFTTNSALWRERLRARTDKTRTIILDDITDNDLRTFLSILYDTYVRPS